MTLDLLFVYLSRLQPLVTASKWSFLQFTHACHDLFPAITSWSLPYVSRFQLQF